MKNKKMKKHLKLIVVIIIIILFVWFLIIKPSFTFREYEKRVEDAARRYFEINSSHLPAGTSRVATVTLQQLFTESYLKDDLYIPYSKKPCSVTESWVKVTKKDNDYNYHVYLKCGVLESKIDHEGPNIILKGDKEIKVERFSKFEDPGIDKVIDKVDGQIDLENVKITGKVDTSKIDTYEINYTVTDSLGNIGKAKRKITVQETLYKTINGKLKKEGREYYLEREGLDNYIMLSNMLFRVIKTDGNGNIIAVADEDVVNINYSKIDEWLNNVYVKAFDKESKKYLVKNKYCKDTPDVGNAKQCKSYTEERYFYIPNAVYINNTKDSSGDSYLKPFTMTWVASSNDKYYVTRNFFTDEYFGKDYYPTEKTDNYGLRPLITINGKSKIEVGDGTQNNPYAFNEIKPGKGGDLVNTRKIGEYIRYAGYIWRIIDTPKDGTTKVIMIDTLSREGDKGIKINYPNKKIYNPNEKGNVGYYINNKVSEYLNTTYFTSHEIKVKIYDKNIVYGEETTTKKYKVKLAAPDMYDLFSAGMMETSGGYSYWLTNSTSDGKKSGVVSDNASIINEELSNASLFGVRLVGYLNKDVTINSGKGTYKKPYIVKE